MKIILSVPHTLPQEEARGRIMVLLARLQARYAAYIADMTELWLDECGTFNCSVLGVPVSGTIRVTGSEVSLRGEAPEIAELFRSSFETRFREEVSRTLSAHAPVPATT